MGWPSKDPDDYVGPSRGEDDHDGPPFWFAAAVTLGCLALIDVIAQLTHRDTLAAFALGGAISSAAVQGTWRLRRRYLHDRERSPTT